MKFSEWFKVDENRARAVELARSFPVTPSAVHQWATDGVPIERMEGVERFTRKAVRIIEMVLESAEFRRVRKAEPAKV